MALVRNGDGSAWSAVRVGRIDIEKETLGERAHTDMKMENYADGLVGPKSLAIRRDHILRMGARADLKSYQGFLPWLESLGEIPPYPFC